VLLLNTGEDKDELGRILSQVSATLNGSVVAIPAKLQADLTELDEADRAAFAEAMAISTNGLELVVRACYDVLNLVTFYTGVGAEARAWNVPRGTSVVDAAGKIHTDMQRGFIRAEVVDFASLDAAGSWQQAHRNGVVRTEGKDYQVREGDVILVRFHV